MRQYQIFLNRMKFILGKKVEMTQKYDEHGQVVPVTKIFAGPNIITQVKNSNKDKYQAVQVGFGARRKMPKPQVGHTKKLGNFLYFREFNLKNDADAEKTKAVKVGDTITVNTFAKGDVVQVTGVSKGKGFQGVVKRWGFHGSPASHGHKDQLRMPGSIGASSDPSRVFKGKKMPGRMGAAQVTVKNLEIIDIDPEHDYLFIKGAVPGARNGLVLISGNGTLSIGIKEDQSQEMPAESKKDESQVTTRPEESANSSAKESTPEDKKENTDVKVEAKPEEKKNDTEEDKK